MSKSTRKSNVDRKTAATLASMGVELLPESAVGIVADEPLVDDNTEMEPVAETDTIMEPVPFDIAKFDIGVVVPAATTTVVKAPRKARKSAGYYAGLIIGRYSIKSPGDITDAAREEFVLLSKCNGTYGAADYYIKHVLAALDGLDVAKAESTQAA